MFINSVNSNSGTNFTGLPQYLRRASVEVLNTKGLSDVIKDAGVKAGIVIETYPKKVFKGNAKIFDGAGQITKKGADMLKTEYGLKKGTCAELRDALAQGYKGYNGDGILDVII